MATLNEVFKKPTPQKTGEKRETIIYLHYKKLRESKWQFYNRMDGLDAYIVELAGWIDQVGKIVQPIEVRKVGIDEYEIISGHRRHQAVEYLVEQENKEQYAFIPCLMRNCLTDVRAEFEGIATNQFGEKNDFIRMKEIERLEALIREHPEEFPEMQGVGRLVDKLARKMNISTSVVKELKTVSTNLCDEAMEQFSKGELKKAAATALVKLPKEKQKELVKKGITTQKEIKQYKASTSSVPKFGTEKEEGKEESQELKTDEPVPKFGTEKEEGKEESQELKTDELVPKFGTEKEEYQREIKLESKIEESRWEKMKHLNAKELAEYLHSHLSPAVMLREESILNWLLETDITGI